METESITHFADSLLISWESKNFQNIFWKYCLFKMEELKCDFKLNVMLKLKLTVEAQ